jgi:outer membrane protein OmpA-like peptidoglycan-associated protein
MSKITSRLAIVGVTALVLGASAPAGAATKNDATVRDIIPQVQDISIVATSLDDSLTDVASNANEQLRLSADVAFDFDKADLKPAASQTLDEIAAKIKSGAKGTVHVDGYTDAVGDNAYNQDLSQRRAQAVADRLKSLIDDTNTYQLAVAGHGSADPVAPNRNTDGSDNPAGRALNRRVAVSFDK